MNSKTIAKRAHHYVCVSAKSFAFRQIRVSALDIRSLKKKHHLSSPIFSTVWKLWRISCGFNWSTQKLRKLPANHKLSTQVANGYPVSTNPNLIEIVLFEANVFKHFFSSWGRFQRKTTDRINTYTSIVIVLLAICWFLPGRLLWRYAEIHRVVSSDRIAMKQNYLGWEMARLANGGEGGG